MLVVGKLMGFKETLIRCEFDGIRKMYECLICNKFVPDYEPKFCCNGSDCGCMGQPTEPCVCSDICANALFNGIGKPYIQRRIEAGIELFQSQSTNQG